MSNTQGQTGRVLQPAASELGLTPSTSLTQAGGPGRATLTMADAES